MMEEKEIKRMAVELIEILNKKTKEYFDDNFKGIVSHNELLTVLVSAMISSLLTTMQAIAQCGGSELQSKVENFTKGILSFLEGFGLTKENI